jgi:hypothetical protein
VSIVLIGVKQVKFVTGNLFPGNNYCTSINTIDTCGIDKLIIHNLLIKSDDACYYY